MNFKKADFNELYYYSIYKIVRDYTLRPIYIIKVETNFNSFIFLLTEVELFLILWIFTIFTTLQTREACKGYPFQVVFNFAGEVLQMSSTDVHQVSESQLAFDFLSRFVPSLPTKPSFQTTDRVTWGVTRIKVCYKWEDLRDRQFAMFLYKKQSISAFICNF